MARAPRTWLFLACLWLSIATALGHAVVPAGTPFEKNSGSAFSAWTTDVSLGPVRTATGLLKRAEAAGGQDDTAFGPDAPPLTASSPAVPQSAAGKALHVRAPGRPVPSFPPVRSFDARAPPRG